MATYAGKDGALYVRAPSGDLTAPTTPNTGTGTLVGQVTNWRLTINQDLMDSTSFGDEFRNYTAGLKGWEASIDVILDPSATKNQDELLEALLSADFSGSLASAGQLQLDMYLDAETAGSNKKAYYGAIFIESVDNVVAVNDQVRASFRCRGNGAIKFTAAGA